MVQSPRDHGADRARPDRSQAPVTITATDVAGTRFTSTSPRAGQGEVIAQAEAALPLVVQSLYGDRLRWAGPRGTDGDRHFALTDQQGAELTLRLDCVPLPSGVVARTHVNTTSDNHFVQLSDRMDPQQVGRALSHEVGELLAVRDRAAASAERVRQDLLRRGEIASDRFRLSEEDLGRVGELNYLAARMQDASLDDGRRREARGEFSALLDHTGLRPIAPAEDTRARALEQHAADIRLRAVGPELSALSREAVARLAVPLEQLPPSDARALRDFREHAARTPSAADLSPGTPHLPGFRPDGTAIPRAELATAAAEAAATRTEVSRSTLEQLRAEAAATGEWPTRQVVIGSGASLVGRDPDALLIDARGRWHLDPGEGIVQSADQVRDMHLTGLGDAHQFGDATSRVPRDAVRLWEDTLAVRGPVVDGRARLVAADDGRLYAHVRPNDAAADRSQDMYVRVEGIPTIATGLPPEMVPGVDRSVQNLPEALDALGRRLPADHAVQQRLATASTAQQTLALLRDEGLVNALRSDSGARAAMQTLDATAQWEHARAEAPARVFIGDEIAENRFDPQAPDAPRTWVVAGAGGTGVANAEIILEADPNARVTIVGPNLPPALANQVQFNAMRRRFDAEFGGDGRLTIDIAPGNRVGAVQMFTGQDGRPRFRAANVEAEAYVGCLGRTSPLPKTLQETGERTRASGGRIHGDLMFDRDRQYLGYGLTFESGGRQFRVEVTGAASRSLPRDVFPVETQRALMAMNTRQVPAVSGNAAPGFAPTAWQAAHLAAARRQGTVQRHATVPESWQRPTTVARSTAPPTGGTASPANPVAGAARVQPGRHSSAPRTGPGSGPGPSVPAQPPHIPRPPGPGSSGGGPAR
ncbi:hypothetical protein [Streptomyces sp. AC602_WCS936]|uniref:hypothetical protein n=1 Tax=Streptomyces sp. AC602_WCS936 TaxID=2823685 RepID=UPI001C273792|nr:hypothetical protein [Streptomyces sp. AC602_WCS936]